MDSSYTAFHFWSRHRKHLIDEHNFFASQARQRQFAQFEDEEMKNAADAHAGQCRGVLRPMCIIVNYMKAVNRKASYVVNR